MPTRLPLLSFALASQLHAYLPWVPVQHTVLKCEIFMNLRLTFVSSSTEVADITSNAKAVLRKALEVILEDHQLQYGGDGSIVTGHV